ncbi:hypothetical protein, partial [Burkholderia ubonensis]|uniref:hypothetical protein n=1 Tax=Burkholderia ubonensis TaxID=101571 RepID=UPI0007C788BD
QDDREGAGTASCAHLHDPGAGVRTARRLCFAASERDAVFHESLRQAQKFGLRAPSMDEIVSAERYAMGSIDYGAKWAYGIVEAMHKAVIPSGASTNRRAARL